MPSNCDIIFDHPNGIYYSGESLNGKIQLITHSPKTINGVHITINGHAKVKWKRKTNHNTTSYAALDEYINSRTYVAGQEDSDPFEFVPGTYDYTFYCELPSTLPSSVSGKYGEIKYEVILTIDRKIRSDSVFKREFTVIKELNLNSFPSLKTPIHATEEKNFCTNCCFGGNGIVKTKLSIPFSGYVPGQKINFSLEVANESENDLEECKVRLVKRIIFESRQPYVKYRIHNIKLDSKYFPQVLKKSNKTFDDYILIPFVPPSSKPEESCVCVSYILDATIETGYCHKNITLEVQLAIGTTPLIEYAMNPNSIITEQPTVLPNKCSIAYDEEWTNML